ncbi:MAG TPA: DUF3857 domain-containing protein [Candidatus Dormibacteraeota bacterium]|jgi:hypothetical protein|nr:DUF3857 domain-containing protein [Candidatus Dormibacteraeota bacterium]
MLKRFCASVFLTTTLMVSSAILAPREASGDDWLPISAEELKMTDLPEAPGAPAVILYRQVDRADKLYGSKEFNYVRIKVLTEEGRKYANVDIPIVGGNQDVSSVRGRSVHTDGSIVNFDGKVYEKTIVKTAGRKYLAKAFTLPDVQVGSIIEYQYYVDFRDRYFYNALWILSDRLFTKVARFTMEPYVEHGLAVRWDYPAGLPNGTKPPAADMRGIVRMEVKNVPAFEEEDSMPPEDEVRQRVEFIYSMGREEQDPDRFWKQFGKKAYGEAEGFAGKTVFLSQITAETVSNSDTPEVKVQKLYDRVQQIRNLTYGTYLSEQEKQRAGIRTNSNAEDVWKSGAGTKHEIDWLFMGMVRAAGFEASPVAISNRKRFFFKKERENLREMDFTGILVKVGAKEMLLDPGAKFAPAGLLPWEETGVPALRLDKDGGTWFQTDLGSAEASQILRKADLKLSEDGTLEGKLTITYSGQEAFARRIDGAVQDEEARRKTLEDQVKEYIPAGSEVQLTTPPDWKTSSPTMTTEFHMKVPGWAIASSKRLLLPVGLFGNAEKHVFEHADRHQAIYFEHPWDKVDEVNVTVPDGWQVVAVPNPQMVDLKAAKYSYSMLRVGNTLHIKRELAINFVLMEQKFYPSLRGFFQTVRTRDEQQIVLQPVQTQPGG